MILKCIALDDEPLALQIIAQYCNKIAYLNLVQTFTNPDEAIAYLNNHTVDFLFLDIQMPDINGMQLYKNLTTKIPVIFTTAYKEYATEGFNVDAIDYLLKPFEFNRFLKAIYKCKEHLTFIASQELTMNCIYVKVNYEMLKINLQDIDLIEALDDYIKIYIQPYPVLTLMTLKSMQEKLPEHNFARVHRSYIIPLHKVEKFTKNKVQVAGKEIPIGNSYADVYDKLLLQTK